LEKIKAKVKEFTIANKVVLVQKYLENPLLVDSRKFDIRAYMLICQDID
jgi:hypothetical protein